MSPNYLYFSKFVVSKKIIRNNLRDKNVLYLDIDRIPKMYADVVMNTNEIDVIIKYYDN